MSYEFLGTKSSISKNKNECWWVWINNYLRCVICRWLNNFPMICGLVISEIQYTIIIVIVFVVMSTQASDTTPWGWRNSHVRWPRRRRRTSGLNKKFLTTPMAIKLSTLGNFLLYHSLHRIMRMMMMRKYWWSEKRWLVIENLFIPACFQFFILKMIKTQSFFFPWYSRAAKTNRTYIFINIYT